MTTMEDSDWSELPGDLLSQVIVKLISSSALDCVRFGAVCIEWRSFLFHNVKFPIKLPLLLIPSIPPTKTTTTVATITTTTQAVDDDDDDDVQQKMNKYNWNNNIPTTTTTTTETTTIVRKSRGNNFYFSLYDRKFYYLETSSWPPLISNKLLCHGSNTHGWLVTLDPYDDFSIRIYNPFNTTSSSSSSSIIIPPLCASSSSVGLVHSDITCWRKIVLSSSPSLNQPNNSFEAMLLVEIDNGCSSNRGYSRFGSALFRYSTQDRVWNTVLKYRYGKFEIDDIIYFRHQFHFVRFNGILYKCDNLDPEQWPSAVSAQPTKTMMWQESKKYLVESLEGDLLQVQRNYNPMLPKFQVFKLLLEVEVEEEEDMKFYKWVEIKTLNGCMLFLSENASMSFSASDLIGYKPNCIYFSDHRRRNGSYEYLFRTERHPIIPLGVGVFNLEDGSIEQHLPPPEEPDYTNSATPIWIETMLYMGRRSMTTTVDTSFR